MVALALVAGCGAKFEAANAGNDGGSGGDASSDDGGPAPDGEPPPDGGTWSPVCPASEPSVGSACPQENVQCEYGSSLNARCNRNYVCTRGVWQTWTPFGGGNCNPGPNPGVCAPTFESVPRGAACAPQGTECDYHLGACFCMFDQFGPPRPVDGGVAPTWHCDDPGPGCPEPRPRIGEACSAPNQQCIYRQCEFALGCMAGYWQYQPVACAQGGGGATP